MSNRCRGAGRHILLVCSFLVAMIGAVQVFAALALSNTSLMLLSLAAGLWGVTAGVSVVILETCLLRRNESSPRRMCSRYRPICIRFSLITTVVIMLVTVSLLHLHHAEIVGPWPEVIASNRTLTNEPVREAFYSKSIWVVTGANVAGAVVSLCAFMSTFLSRGSSNFTRHRNLCFVESSGWVYESSPRPGNSSDSPSRRLIAEQASASHHRSDRYSMRSGTATLQSFKQEGTLTRHGALSKQTSKDKLILVDSNVGISSAQLSMSFTSSGYVVCRHTVDRNGSSRSHTNGQTHYIPLKDLAEVSECSSPETSSK